MFRCSNVPPGRICLLAGYKNKFAKNIKKVLTFAKQVFIIVDKGQAREQKVYQRYASTTGWESGQAKLITADGDPHKHESVKLERMF